MVEPAADGHPRRPRARLVLAFVVLAAAMGVARLHTFDEPLERDLTTYAVIGHEMLGGRALYSDLWDHKPPAVHVTYALAESLVGYGPGQVYLLGLVAAVVTLFGVMASGAAFGARAALWAGVFWALLSGDMMLQANQPNVEVFINASLILAFALFVHEPIFVPWPGRAWLIGAAFATAVLYKPVAAATAAFLLAVYVLLPVVGAADRRSRLLHAAIVAAVIAVAGLSVVAWFVAHGRFDAFWDAVVVYNGDYQRRGWRAFGVVSGLWPSPTWILLPLFALSALGAGADLRWGGDRRWYLLAAFLAGTFLSIILPGYRHPHYFQLWMPAVCVGAGWGVEALMRRWLASGWVLAGAALATFLVYELPNYRLTPDQWSEAKYGQSSRYGGIFVATRDLAPKLDAVLLPGETFYEIGDETGLYFLTQRRPPSGVIYAFPLFVGPLTQSLSTRILDDLRREPPELVIVTSGYVIPGAPGTMALPAQPAIGTIIQDYELRWMIEGKPSFFLLTRRGGALEARLRSSPDAPEFQALMVGQKERGSTP